MQTYCFTCPLCGPKEVRRPMATAHLPAYCPVCDVVMARSYAREGKGLIVRPGGYRLSPEDPNWSRFDRELELGEVREPDPNSPYAGDSRDFQKLSEQNWERARQAVFTDDVRRDIREFLRAKTGTN
jgi:hypothetical protein